MKVTSTEFRWKMTEIMDKLDKGEICTVQYHKRDAMIIMSPTTYNTLMEMMITKHE